MGVINIVFISVAVQCLEILNLALFLVARILFCSLPVEIFEITMAQRGQDYIL
jgi:hypothetical protein